MRSISLILSRLASICFDESLLIEFLTNSCDEPKILYSVNFLLYNLQLHTKSTITLQEFLLFIFELLLLFTLLLNILNRF